MTDWHIPSPAYATVIRRAMLCWGNQTGLTLGSVTDISFKITDGSKCREARAWTPAWYALWITTRHQAPYAVAWSPNRDDETLDLKVIGDIEAFERDMIALKLTYSGLSINTRIDD